MFFTKWFSYLSLAILLLITVYFGKEAAKLKFIYDVESFISENDSDMQYYQHHRTTFENDNNFVLIGIANKKGIFKKDFLSKINTLTQGIEKLNNVISVNSPTNIKRSIISPLGVPIDVALLHFKNPNKYKKDSIYIYSSELYKNALFSEKSNAVSIYIKRNNENSKASKDSLLQNLENLIKKQSFDQYHIAGQIKTQNYYVTNMNSEMKLFSIISLILLIAYLTLTFKNIWAVIIPIVTILISTIITFGIIQLLGHKIDLLATMMPTLLFVIGISTSVHLISRYIDELRRFDNKIDAMKTALKEVGIAAFLSSVTTAIGFFTLLTLKIPPIQKFGLFTGIGVLITFGVTIIVIPAVFINIKIPKTAMPQPHKRKWEAFMDYLFVLVSTYSKTITIGFLVLTVVSIFGIKMIKVNNYFLDDLENKSSLKQDLLFFENNFSGIRPFELGIQIKNNNDNILSLKSLQNIEKIENYLKKEYGVGFLFSPVTVIKTANQTLNGGKQNQFVLPKTEKETQKIIRKLKTSGKLRKLNKIITENLLAGRITGKMNDVGSKSIRERNLQFNRFLDKEIDSDQMEVKITGAAQLLDKANADISQNLLKGLGLAFIIIAVVIMMLFKSVKIGLISLIPNIFPLIVIGGIMGFLNVHLKIGTSIIFTIAFGIAVDDTIHLLKKVKSKMNSGSTIFYALKSSFSTTGKALILTSFILSAGFIIFMLSAFRSTFYIGALISFTLIIAVISDLFLLPILLLWALKNKKSD